MTARRALCLGLTWLLVAGGDAGAADDPGPGGTSEELAGWAAVEEGKWVRARELGEQLLRARSDSFAGHYVLGVAMHYGEGDLPRSALHLERAVALFERAHGPRPDKRAPRRWHAAALKELGFTYGEMDRPAEELVVFDRYDAVYEPKRLAQRIWPLMKLRRYDEARRVAKLAIAATAPEQRIIARSDLCAAECEAGNRELAHTACTDALTDYRQKPTGGQVEFSNASEAALAVLKYDEAERFLHESTRRAVPDSWGNPFQHLASLYISEGRVVEAIAAMKGGQELRLRRPPWLDQHGQARLDGTLAELLLVAGQTERAVAIAQRAVDRPDRQGVQSGTEHQAQAASALRLAAALDDLATRTDEEATVARLVPGLRLRAQVLALRLRAWRARRRAAVLLADEELLARSLRPYYVGGVDLPPWMGIELVSATGGGVVLTALARARGEETLAAARPFFDALAAEAEFARGDPVAAEPPALAALRELPRAESLLIARVAAIAGEAARRRGDDGSAAERFTIALTKDPRVLRRLGIRLPVAVEPDGSGLARIAAGLVARSPRFRDGGGGFVVALSGAAPATACLYGPGRSRLQCATLAADKVADDDDRARRLVAELHRVAFALKADLSQADLTTLDGSPTSQRADRQVKSLLDDLAK